MLVHCPACQSPVFVRSAAIEQRKPQRCYACKAQLLVDAEGSVELAGVGERSAPGPDAPAGPAPMPPRSFAAPRPVTAVTALPTTSALEGGGHPAAATAFDRTAEGPAPVSLGSLPPVGASSPSLPAVSSSEAPKDAPAPPFEAPREVPRHASLPDLPTFAFDDPFPFGGEVEAFALPAAHGEKEAALLAAAAERAPSDSDTLLSPFDISGEGAAPASRFANVPVEELFDRSGGHLTQATFDDPPHTSGEGLPAATGVPLEPSEEEPPLVEGALVLDDAPLELARPIASRPAMAPAPVPPAPNALGAVAPRPALVPGPSATPVPAPSAAAPPGPSPGGSTTVPSPNAARAEHTTVAIRRPPSSSRGALAWVAAGGLGAALGLAALFAFPPAPERTPLEQKLAASADLLGKGRAVDAVPLLEDALQAAPDHPLALRRMGVAASLLGDGARAEQHYLRYLEVSDDDEGKREVRRLLGLGDGAR